MKRRDLLKAALTVPAAVATAELLAACSPAESQRREKVLYPDDNTIIASETAGNAAIEKATEWAYWLVKQADLPVRVERLPDDAQGWYGYNGDAYWTPLDLLTYTSPGEDWEQLRISMVVGVFIDGRPSIPQLTFSFPNPDSGHYRREITLQGPYGRRGDIFPDSDLAPRVIVRQYAEGGNFHETTYSVNPGRDSGQEPLRMGTPDGAVVELFNAMQRAGLIPREFPDFESYRVAHGQ